jgi:hypothetical protein
VPISEKQFAANRANAAKSTGPRSPEGQGRSSQNARTYAFTPSTFAVVRLEELDEIARLKQDLLAVYQPVNPQELFALEQMKSHAPKIVTTPWPTASIAWPGRTIPFRCFYAIRSAPSAFTAARSKNSTVSNAYGLNSQTNPFWSANSEKMNEFAPQSTNPFQNGTRTRSSRSIPQPRKTPRWTRPASEAVKNRKTGGTGGSASAIGRKVTVRAQKNVEIIGVARDSKYRSVRRNVSKTRISGKSHEPLDEAVLGYFLMAWKQHWPLALEHRYLPGVCVPRRTSIMISCDRNPLLERSS